MPGAIRNPLERKRDERKRRLAPCSPAAGVVPGGIARFLSPLFASFDLGLLDRRQLSAGALGVQGLNEHGPLEEQGLAPCIAARDETYGCGARSWPLFQLLCVLLVGLFPIPQLAHAAKDAPTTEDVLYLGDVPVLLRIQLVVDGKPWTKARHELAKRQFALLDIDKDGQLTLEQVATIPLPGFDPSDASQWDSDPQNGKISAAEFLSIFEEHGQPSFLLAEGTSQAASRIKLFPHLDTNEDGRLTEEELARAKNTLKRLDYDDDETISTTELAPFVNPLFQQAVVGRETPLTEDAPFVAVGSFDTKDELALALLKRYGTSQETEDVLQWTCDYGNLGPEKQLKAFDEDGDGKLNHAEVAKFLEAKEPDVVLQVELPSRRSSRPKIKLLADSIGASKRKPSRIRGSSRLPLKAGKAAFDVRVQNALTKTSDNRNFFLLEFRRADMDKNTYLDANEFRSVGIPASFDSVDLDGDEKIVRDEMIAFLERDAFATQSQVVMSVAADTQTLFHVMDVDIDQRLTAREFNEIGNRLQYLDANRDGTIEMTEIAHEFRVLFTMGRPRVFQQAMTMQRNSGGPAPRATPNPQAPDWFGKMDRNQDGDLSWREFLGRREVFDRMDKDGDGLITVDELE